MIANVLINWIAAIGLFVLLLCLRQVREESAATQRIIWLTFAATMLFGWRAISWATGSLFMESVEMILAAVLFFLLLLATEGVLRRHAHVYVKYAVAGCLIAFILGVLIGHRRIDPWFSYALAITQVATLVFCIGWLLLRDRTSRSDAENRTADVFAFALILAATLFITDYDLILSAPVRLGALGFLMAAYVIVSELSPQQNVGKLFKEAVAVVSVSAILTLMAVSAFGLRDNLSAILQLTGLSLTLFLTAIILLRYLGLRVDRTSDLPRYLLGANTGSLDEFLLHALSAPDVLDAEIVLHDTMQDYDISTIEKLLKDIPVYSRGGVTDNALKAEHASAIEQLNNLLEYRGATHAARIDSDPTSLLLASAPALGARSEVETYLALVSKMTSMISDKTARAGSQ